MIDSERMELCSLTEAFPDLQKPNSPSKEERKAARKRAKKCKGPDLQYLKEQDDLLPPAADTLKKLGEIPAFTSYEDAFNDLSGSTVEGFKLPRLPATNTLFSDQGLPDYFGKGLEDEDAPGPTKEGFSNMETNGGDSFEYMFGKSGAEKAGSSDATLPDPMLNDLWKPLTPAKTRTAFFQGKQGNGRESSEYVKEEKRKRVPVTYKSKESDPDSMRNLMATQLEDLQRRMDQLSLKQPRDSKNEILLFVGTGVFLLLSFELIVRAAKR